MVCTTSAYFSHTALAVQVTVFLSSQSFAIRAGCLTAAVSLDVPIREHDVLVTLDDVHQLGKVLIIQTSFI